MSDSTIRFESVSKFFGKVRALDSVDFALERGSIFCLLGANGAGKSTALRLLLNRMAPTSGAIRVLDKPAPHLRSDDFRRIAFVSESQKLYDWMTLSAQIRAVKPLYPNWDDGYCGKLIELFRLPLDRKIKTLSRGMRMKVKMLLAFSFQPEVVVMDEPFTGLDPIVRQECIEGLIDWANEGDRTLVISSHDIDDIEPICDRVGILHEGSLILDEALDSLKGRMRRATFHCEDEGVPGVIPSSWIQLKRKGRSFEFVDTNYAGPRSEARLKEACPSAADIHYSPMSLRDLFVSIVSNAENQALTGKQS